MIKTHAIQTHTKHLIFISLAILSLGARAESGRDRAIREGAGVLANLIGKAAEKFVGNRLQGPPSGGPQLVGVGPGCEVGSLQEALMREYKEPARQAQILKAHMRNCAEGLRLREQLFWQNDYMSNIKAEATRAQLKEMQIKLSNSQDLPLWLGVQRGANGEALRRPLVIIQCGTQCNLDHFTTYVAAMHMFDEGPFHVVALPSTSGARFQRLNKTFAVGGYFEGRIILDVARRAQMADSPLASELSHDKVSSVHVYGVSLGGHSALMAAAQAKDPLHLLPSGEAPIRSVLAVSPVVDLQKSLNYLFIEAKDSPWSVGDAFWEDFWNQVEKLYVEVPEIAAQMRLKDGQALPKKKPKDKKPIKIKAKEAPSMIAATSMPILRAQFAMENEPEGDTELFWRLNRFQDVAHKVQVPTYIFAAHDDEVVNYQQNSALVAGQNPLVQVIDTAHGNHVFFERTYGWHLIGAIQRTLPLSQSVELTQNMRIKAIEAGRLGLDVGGGRERLELEWKVSKGSERATLSSKVLIREYPRGYGRQTDLRAYEQEVNASIRLSTLGLAEPQSEYEAQRLTRWLNANIQSVGRQGRALSPWEDVREFQWWSFE